ncbi:MAG TPA: Uma2 family endonuclease [Planctomycetaceae bacterium]|jgi:Uma2 family endonuclease|nr:Uma2 family endonuclease [Planctomycetaceae bacterium]
MSVLLPARLNRPNLLTVADIAKRFGAIPSWRIRSDPPPGTAEEADVLRVEAGEDRLCELIDGTLVEKVVGYEESILAGAILAWLRNFVRPRRLGIVAGEAGTLKFAPGLVFIPDVSFVAFASLPGGKRPREPIPHIIPDLAVEILSPSNTAKEMQRKLVAYFRNGVKLVWFVDPQQRTVEVYTAPKSRTVLKASQVLTGGSVLPGFRLKLRDLFAELDEA